MRKNALLTVCGVVGFIAIKVAFSEPAHHNTHIDVQKSHQHYVMKKRMFATAMDEFITAEMGANNAVGLSIVVVDNDQVVYKKGFGYADKEQGVSVQPSTLFHIGSITKLFTGLAIMQLAQKRLIDIDAPIRILLWNKQQKFSEI